MLQTNITDGRGGSSRAAVSSDGFLCVETRDFYNWENKVLYFSSDLNGSNMAVNTSPSGTPTGIHNGTDNTYWTATAVSGVWTFNSTVQSHTGTKSIDGRDTANNNTAQIRKPSGTQDLTGYTSLSGWIYITAWSQVGIKQINIYGYNNNTATTVGTPMNIGNYVTTTSLNTWQRFTIPLIDLGLTGAIITAIRINTVDTGGGTPIDFFLDDIQFNIPTGGGGTDIYSVNAQPGKVLEVYSISFNIAGEYDSTIANGTMPGLSYNRILGLNELEGGILYRRIQNNEVKSSWNLKNLYDMIKRPQARLINSFYGGVNTFICVEWSFVENHTLLYPSRDRLTITLSDNFSTLEKFEVIAMCRIRDEINGS